MSQMQTTLRDQRGFTLTELLVVAAVLGMILSAVVLVQQQGQQAYIFGSHRVEVQQNATIGYNIVLLNNSRPPFNNRLARQAVPRQGRQPGIGADLKMVLRRALGSSNQAASTV